MTKIVGAQRSLQRFYLLGRDEAEDDFDPEEIPSIEELATAILDGAELRETLRPPIEKLLEIDEFDGAEDEWKETYAVELEGVDAKAARELWRKGYVDEALLDLESVVVDQMAELLDMADDEEDEDDDESPAAGYAAFADDGRDDALDTWDADDVDDLITDALAEVGKSLWQTTTDRTAAVTTASKKAAETYQRVAEEDGARQEWDKLYEHTARNDGLNPDVAYNDHWRPAFVAETAKLFAHEIGERIERAGPPRARAQSRR